VAEGPLAGRAIVVTRPAAQAGPLVDGLAGLGATVALVPLVAVEPVEDPGPLARAMRDSGYDWVVFTSANGVLAAAQALAGEPLAGEKLAAVGPATADAVRDLLGVEASFVPAVHAAEEIAAGLGPIQGARVLLPQADIASPELAVELRARGALVDAIAAYRTVAVEPSPDQRDELERGPDAVILASGSAARSLAALRIRFDEGTRLVCIGPKTAEAVRSVGLPVGLVADEATTEGIIQALTTHFGESQ
jgi:uroporphyrinogen-III synthase